MNSSLRVSGSLVRGSLRLRLFVVASPLNFSAEGLRLLALEHP